MRVAAEVKEAEYLSMAERHKAGKRGKRGRDGPDACVFVDAMQKRDADILGDLFQGSVRCVTACEIPEQLGWGEALPRVIGLT